MSNGPEQFLKDQAAKKERKKYDTLEVLKEFISKSEAIFFRHKIQKCDYLLKNAYKKNVGLVSTQEPDGLFSREQKKEGAIHIYYYQEIDFLLMPLPGFSEDDFIALNDEFRKLLTIYTEQKGVILACYRILNPFIL